MSTMEVLEGRVYTIENRMFGAAGRLSEGLHRAEHEIAALHEAVHQLVCEQGRMPIEVKTAEVVDRIGRALVAMDVDGLRELRLEVASLKEQIEVCELEMQELRGSPRPVAFSAA
jgi:hypothetical protein